MEGEVEKRAGDLHPALVPEAVRMARAQRRLVEFELTRRRTLLVLSVILLAVGIFFTAISAPPAGIASGIASLSVLVAGLRRDTTR